MDEEDKHSLIEFYYPEDLETLDAQTETGSVFYYLQKPSAIIINNLLTELARALLGNTSPRGNTDLTVLGPHCHDL